MVNRRADIVAGLQSDILRLQGFKPLKNPGADPGLGPILDCFPNKSFPTGAIHEFIASRSEDNAASAGFIAGLLSALIGVTGATVWISASRKLFPPALKHFGLEPEHFIFIDLKKEKEVMWATDEALKCPALSAVVCEVSEISFNESRRFQLAVEQSQVTGFIIRQSNRKLNTTACISRWKISSVPSELSDGLPGVGFPTWRVELLRVRNGQSGIWELQWVKEKFRHVLKSPASTSLHKKAG